MNTRYCYFWIWLDCVNDVSSTPIIDWLLMKINELERHNIESKRDKQIEEEYASGETIYGHKMHKQYILIYYVKRENPLMH